MVKAVSKSGSSSSNSSSRSSSNSSSPSPRDNRALDKKILRALSLNSRMTAWHCCTENALDIAQWRQYVEDAFCTDWEQSFEGLIIYGLQQGYIDNLLTIFEELFSLRAVKIESGLSVLLDRRSGQRELDVFVKMSQVFLSDPGNYTANHWHTSDARLVAVYLREVSANKIFHTCASIYDKHQLSELVDGCPRWSLQWREGRYKFHDRMFEGKKG